MENIKILIADDEIDIRELMAKKIARDGYEVIQARDGQEAWELINSQSPDVILLDLTMPRMDGFTVLKNLRARPPSDKFQPVIIVSALDKLDDVRDGLSLGADHYLVKPCHMEDILKAIRLMVSLIPSRKSKIELDKEAN